MHLNRFIERRKHLILKFLFRKELKELVCDFRYGLFRFMKYQAGTKILLGLLIPFFMFFVNTLLHKKGLYTITNSDLLGFAKSYEGAISALLLFSMGLFIILIELGGLVAISGQSHHRQKESSFYSILRFSLKNIPQFFGIGGAFITLFFLVLMPFFNIGPTTTLVGSLEVPGFIKVYIDNSLLYKSSYFMLLGICIIFAVRWMFGLHLIILEGCHPKQALKESSIMVRENWKFILKHFASITLGLVFSVFLLVMLWFLAVEIIIENVGIATAKAKFIVSLLIVIQEFGGFIIAFFTIPFEIQHITKIFYTIRSEMIFQFKIPKKKGLSIMDRILRRKKTIIAMFVLTILSLSGMFSLVLDEVANIQYDTKITAHRANTKEAPENSLAALQIAISHGADFAEIDVQESRDSKIFVAHDSNLKNITGRDANVWEMDYSEISKLTLVSEYDDYQDEGIPLLKEAIELCRGKIKLNIEIKRNGHEKDLVRNVVDVIIKNNFTDECVVTSLDYDVLEEVERIAPQIRTGYVMYFVKGDISNLKVDFLSVEESNISDLFLSTAHLENKEVHAWTVNEEDDMLRLIQMGVDNIITDDDELLKYVIKDLKERPKLERIEFLVFE